MESQRPGFEARENDLVFQEYLGTNSLMVRGFPSSERVLREDSLFHVRSLRRNVTIPHEMGTIYNLAEGLV